jgi:hypothetical protein
MSRYPRRFRFWGVVAGATALVLAAADFAPAQTDQDDNNNARGVRIIDSPTPPPPPGSPSQVLKAPDVGTANPPLLTPAVPSPAAAAPPPDSPSQVLKAPDVGTANPPLLTPAVPSPAAAAPPPDSPSQIKKSSDVNSPPLLTPVAPSLSTTIQPPVPATQPSAGAPSTSPESNNFANVPSNLDVGDRPTQLNLETLTSGIKLPNSAGLSMQMLPGPDIAAGSRVSFQISSKKPGYLILVDVDATGKLIQIYPNPMSLMVPSGVREKSNFIQPGKALQIPDSKSAYSGFEFVASPPLGTAMVVALFSDRPVQLVDLPDVPSSLVGRASAVDYLSKLANQLRIPSVTGNDRLDDAHWSFDVKFYSIR